jgi:hypothetical protein
MNEGTLAIMIIVATIGVGIVAVMYRDLIFPTGAPPSRQRRPAQLRRLPAARPRVSPALARSETAPKSTEAVSVPVSPIATPDSDPETIAFQVLAKLVHAGVVTETMALEHAFGVRAGSSKAYTTVRAKLKTALAELSRIDSESTLN